MQRLSRTTTAFWFLRADRLLCQSTCRIFRVCALASPTPIQADRTTFLDTPAGPQSVGPGNALPATRQELINAGLDKTAVFENWGMPWNSTIRFGGLAYCFGGRSLYFGGWSP